MKQVVYLMLGVLILGGACNRTNNNSSEAEKQVIKSKVDSLETLLFEKIERHHEGISKELKTAYLEYSGKYPDDELTPEYYFRAANMARALKNYPEALDIYRVIVKDYPDFEHHVESHFMIALVYDNDLKDKFNAKRVYNEVAEKYPNHKFGQDAKLILDTYIEMTDEELIKYLEEKNKDAETDVN